MTLELEKELADIDSKLQPLLNSVYSGENLNQFINRISPHLPPPEHVQPLIRIIEETRHRKVKYLVDFPPGHAKTTTISHGVAYLLDKNPADTSAYVTHGAGLSRSKSRLMRGLARDSGITLASDSNNLSEWRTTAGGGLLATGVGGPLTGQRITGCLFIDDPYKNREDADSPGYREKLSEWLKTVGLTRLENASVIVVHTRWHPDDLIAELEKTGKFEHLHLPAIAEEGDYLGRAVGDALWPDLYPRSSLDEQRELLGEWEFQALYQGNPRAKGTRMFDEPHWYDPDKFDPEGAIVYIAADPAASVKTYADFSVGIAMAIKGAGLQRTAYILDLIRGQWTIPDFARRMLAFQRKWYGAPVGIEAVAGFKAVPQIMAEADPSLRIKELYPVGDKKQRAEPAAAAWNAGRVLVPMNRPWTSEFIKIVCAFTGLGDAQDDDVDAMSHCWNMGAGPVVLRRTVEAPSRWR